jgi:hypothetical protein
MLRAGMSAAISFTAFAPSATGSLDLLDRTGGWPGVDGEFFEVIYFRGTLSASFGGTWPASISNWLRSPG